MLLMHGLKLAVTATTVSTAAVARRASSSGAYICAVVYVSEGRDDTLLDSLVPNATKRDLTDVTARDAGLIREFRDSTYHRTGFTIGGSCPVSVAKASLDICRRALRVIDLQMHEASHPRIGVVDHVSVHPLGPQQDETRLIAREVGMVIAKALGEEEGVPVLLYGDLKEGRGLAEVNNLQA